MEGGLEEVMVNYFKGLLVHPSWGEVVDCIQNTVTADQNACLTKPVEAYKEVKHALCHMHSDKSPGPDDMSPGFYQRYWSIVGNDIVRMVRIFFKI